MGEFTLMLMVLKRLSQSFVRHFWVVCSALLLSTGLNVLAAWHEPPSSASPQEVRIGVLALRGVPQAMENWSATADYLAQKVPGHRFKVVPLDFDQVEHSTAGSFVDFVIVNPVLHVLLAERYATSPIATMINRLDDYDASLYGGVVFRRAGTPGPATLKALKGKRFLAVDPLSLGGFLAASLEFHKNQLDPDKHFSSLEFAGTHDAVVLGVLAGTADAGTVRTDVLERMAADGTVNLADIEVISSYTNDNNGRFPYLRSTRLYPEWPIAKLTAVPDRLARQVAIALLAMPADSQAAQKAEIVGWNVPMTYVPVVDLLRELSLPPFDPQPIKLRVFMDRQPLAAFLIAGGIVVTGGLMAFLVLLIRRLRRARISLVEANEVLEERVQERTEALQTREAEMETLATHDPLTGLFNRRALEARVLEEVNRVNRYGHPLSVLMLDIDFFKKINDGFGHIAGDHVLTELAKLLQGTLRNTDVIARYGGEEFVVLLPMTTQTDAIQLAERLCQIVAEHDLEIGNGQIVHVTISIGIASIENKGNARWDVLIDSADQAMYRAKQGGRNQVVADTGR